MGLMNLKSSIRFAIPVFPDSDENDEVGVVLFCVTLSVSAVWMPFGESSSAADPPDGGDKVIELMMGFRLGR